ncbi:MAG TPA: hypothetical protein GX506_08010 [Firmicutes bacterium]|nr:hypothetical protein [Bacillota bacterium]
MNEILLTIIFIAKRVLLLSGTGALVVAALGRPGFSLGLLAGAACSLANLSLLGMSLVRIAETPPPMIARFAGWRYVLRYSITGATLYLALRWGTPQFIGAITGLLLVKYVILAHGVLGYRGRWK